MLRGRFGTPTENVPCYAADTVSVSMYLKHYCPDKCPDDHLLGAIMYFFNVNVIEKHTRLLINYHGYVKFQNQICWLYFAQKRPALPRGTTR